MPRRKWFYIRPRALHPSARYLRPRWITPAQYPRVYPAFLSTLLAQIALCKQDGKTTKQIAALLGIRASLVRAGEFVVRVLTLHPTYSDAMNQFLTANRPQPTPTQEAR